VRPFFDEQVRALWAVRLVRGIDLAVVLAIAAILTTGFFWAAFGHPTFEGLLALWLLVLLIVQLWLVMLVYRACYFVLMVRADINLVTENAAKLVIRYGAQAGAGAPPGL
jgi:membrane protein YdbS with pleckstrin-like domain